MKFFNLTNILIWRGKFNFQRSREKIKVLAKKIGFSNKMDLFNDTICDFDDLKSELMLFFLSS